MPCALQAFRLSNATYQKLWMLWEPTSVWEMSTRKKKKFHNDEWEIFRRHCLVCHFQSKRQLTSSLWGWDVASLNDRVWSQVMQLCLIMLLYCAIARITVNYGWSSRWGNVERRAVLYYRNNKCPLGVLSKLCICGCAKFHYILYA